MSKFFSKKLAAAGAAFAVGAVGLTAPGAFAGSGNDSFSVTANVVDTCTISAADMAFGDYDPLSVTPTVGTSNLTVSCTLLAPYTIELDAGVGNSATTTARQMENAGGDQLEYSIFQDVTHLLLWGLAIDTLEVSGIGTGLPVPTTMFGQIVANQQVASGAYSDTVTATINF